MNIVGNPKFGLSQTVAAKRERDHCTNHKDEWNGSTILTGVILNQKHKMEGEKVKSEDEERAR